MPKNSSRPNPFKGLNSLRKKLADGSTSTYWYAFKGGPRLPGAFGSPEFVQAYVDATRAKKEPPAGVIFSLLAGYQASQDFKNLAPRTRADYIKLIKVIETEFGDFPIAYMADRRTKGIFLAWRDRLAERSPRQADYAFTVLARVLSWSLKRGLIDANPCEKPGRIYRGTRIEKVWTDDDERAFLLIAQRQFHLPLQIALWTGQRQGDILALTWRQYDGEKIRLQQGKTGARVAIPVGQQLAAILDKLKADRGAGPFDRICLNSRGEPWTEAGFSSAFGKQSDLAGVVGLTFHDTRGTAVTRLMVAGATVPETATFTGHSLRDVSTILDAHYLSRDPALAANAARKLETRTHSPNQSPNRAPVVEFTQSGKAAKSTS
jgi:integrase